MISHVLYRHRRLVYLGAAALALAGGLALGRLASGIYPDVAFPRISVIAEAGEDSVENIELSITRPLEQAVSIVQGIRRVRSKTLRGACEMSIDFEPATDMVQALQEVRARIGQTQSQLPPDLHLTVERQTPSIFPVISYHVTLDAKKASGRFKETADLNDWALLELKPRLARLRDVFLVTVQSADVHEIVIEASPAALAARGLNIADLVLAVDKSNKVGVVGRLDKDGKRYQVLVTGQLRSLEELESVAVPLSRGKVVSLSELATIKESVADKTSVITGDGCDAVVVNVFMRAGGRVTELSLGVKGVVEEMEGLLPRDVVRLRKVYDQDDLVNASLEGVRDAIVIGGVLSPLAILGTFALMPLFGLTLNLMSLGGIAIAIGLVVDDAIVVIECIARHRARGEGRFLAVDRSVREVAGAVIGSSLTTIVVFAPLVLLEGVYGQFMKALSLTLALAIILSLGISLTLMPVMALGPLGGGEGPRQESDRLGELYGRVASVLLRWRKLGWTSLLLVLVLAGMAVIPGPWGGGVKTGFLPDMDEGSFVLDYKAPVGTALPETDKRVREIEVALVDTSLAPEIAVFSRRTGQELGLFATEAWKGDFLVSLRPKAERKATGPEVMERLRGYLTKKVPQLDLEFVQLMQDTLNDLSGEAKPIEVKIFGRDHRALAGAIARARKRLASVPGLVDLSRGASFGSPEIFFRVDPALAARRGVSTDDVEQGARASLLGVEATKIRRSDRLVPVRVRWPDPVRQDERWIEGLPIEKDGKTFPISVLSSRQELSNQNELTRENQQPVAILTASIEGTDLGTAAAAVEKALADLPLPEGAHQVFAGQAASAKEARANMALVLGLGTFLVLVLLVAQFGSFAGALVIFLALPFSQVGGLLALRLTGLPLNISSFMGLIMLVGLVVKNGILLVDYTERLRGEGLSLEDALVRAGRVRLRPILMTSLTAIMGLLPLALNLGAGAELQKPLAVAVIGGLSLSTVFTLVVVPLAMLVFAKKPLHDEAPAA
ncbi:efflux RND transporter permease subunit [bacterium]|nr:efflux RND transporter permease subunit [bacterium]